MYKNIWNFFGHKNIHIFSEQKAKMSAKNEREQTQKKMSARQVWLLGFVNRVISFVVRGTRVHTSGQLERQCENESRSFQEQLIYWPVDFVKSQSQKSPKYNLADSRT